MSTMPPQNFQLILRPASLQNHSTFISIQAGQSLSSELFSDLIFLTPDGPASCHLALMVPLSPFLQSLFSSLSTYYGLVHTVLTSINLNIIRHILTIIYTGKVTVKDRQDMDLVLAGMKLLGISLPGLECLTAVTQRGSVNIGVGQALDLSINRGKMVKVETNNNNSIVINTSLPLPFSTHGVSNSIKSLLSSIVQLPNLLPEMKPQLSAVILPPPQLSLLELQTQLASQLLPLAIDESVQCNVVGCSSQVSLRVLATHFKLHAGELQPFKCVLCTMVFQHKKALEIHRIEDHLSEHQEMFHNGIIDEVNTTDGNVVPRQDCDTRKKRKRKNQTNFVGSELTDIENGQKLDKSVVEATLACVLCQAVLPSEWHKPPGRHKCPHATPKTVLTSNTPDQPHCPLCDTTVPTSWHKPPSRHACAAFVGSVKKRARSVDVNSQSKKKADTGEMTIKEQETPENHLCPLSNCSADSNRQSNKKEDTDENTIGKLESSEVHPCPLSNCSRQCKSRKKLLVHLAMKHYLEELEKKFGTGCEASQCPECSLVLPRNKLGFIKHVAVEHEMVMTYVKRDCAMEKSLDKALESVCNMELPGEESAQSASGKDGAVVKNILDNEI